MRLAEFIEANTAAILSEWERFAATRLPAAASMDSLALRDHAPQILKALAHDLRQPQSKAAQLAKSRGLPAAEPSAPDSAAEVHGAVRARTGFSMSQLVSEFRALRASVLDLWTRTGIDVSGTEAVQDVSKFNEAVDQAVAESVEYFEQELERQRSKAQANDKALTLNQARLEYATRLSHVGFWYCDLPFDELEWDAQVKEHFFFAPDARITIQDFYDRIYPDDREMTRQAIETSIQHRGAYDIIYRTCHPTSGQIKWIRALGGTDYADDGSPIHFDGITVDVTAEKLKEIRIAESEAWHRGVLTNMNEGFALFDATFQIIEVNDMTCELVQMPRSELIGRNHWQAFPESYESDFGVMYRQVLADGQPKTVERDYTFPNGRNRWFEVRAFKVGEGLAVLFRDVTERRQMLEALKETDRRKDEFLAMLAHELRNPLSPVRTASAILRSDKLLPGQLGWAAQVIDRQVGHMAKLLDDLLDVARITRGKLKIDRQVAALQEMVEAAVESSRALIEERRHVLTVDMPTQGILLEADPVRIAQILSNLLVNAARYTDPGGTIQLSARSAGGKVVLQVTDSGIGLEPQDIGHLFEMFSQGRHPKTASSDGLGIGLALSRALAVLHGGTLAASSAGRGRGSSFTLELPCSAGQPMPTSTTAQVPVQPLRILVVDDNQDAADTLAAMLQLDGHDIRVAYSGEHAIKVFSDFAPDAAILDVGMPGMSGYELVGHLRSKSNRQRPRLAALTGWGQAADRDAALAAGFDRHLTKPADLSQVRALLAEWAAESAVG